MGRIWIADHFKLNFSSISSIISGAFGPSDCWACFDEGVLCTFLLFAGRWIAGNSLKSILKWKLSHHGLTYVLRVTQDKANLSLPESSCHFRLAVLNEWSCRVICKPRHDNKCVLVPEARQPHPHFYRLQLGPCRALERTQGQLPENLCGIL